MRNAERALWALVCAALVVALLVARRPPAARTDAASRPRAQPGLRVSMATLHAQGGVPLGWQPSLPPGDPKRGRTRFDELGCPACHLVAGERFASAGTAPVGPELTGMGSHHPAAYFAEAILDPDAVLIDEPGYLGEDGRSIMPTYDDMTLGDLADVVAYLTSLTSGAEPSCHDPDALDVASPAARTSVRRADRPPPPASAARIFFAQSYDVLPGKLSAFEAWFAGRGRGAFRETPGLASLHTFVDVAKPGGAMTTIFGFRDEASLRTFTSDPATAELWKDFDGFVGPHGHVAADGPLVYHVPSLSVD